MKPDHCLELNLPAMHALKVNNGNQTKSLVLLQKSAVLYKDTESNLFFFWHDMNLFSFFLYYKHFYFLCSFLISTETPSVVILRKERPLERVQHPQERFG